MTPLRCYESNTTRIEVLMRENYLHRIARKSKSNRYYLTVGVFYSLPTVFAAGVDGFPGF
ncbi:MAG: hypothetical protein BA873_14600 [Desulfobulbaceae bacterium C00003063]|nr:MAG: hypothetical protein BA873_14600 [Desulfobulbaceae bacterium C00003063]